ncbi:MAG: FecR domain-containing protein [Cyclobacteriaceae bacterium]
MNEQLAKYFSGECTKDEIKQVNSWRSESFDNSKEFNEAKNIWVSLQEAPEPDNRILDGILGEADAKVIKISRGWNWTRYAAAAVVILGLVFSIRLSLSGDDSIQKLADGSEIVLHGESSINSVSITDNIREVRLTGKAYFDIERDESRPFIIITENARIEVLGTSFVIDASTDKTEVSVESGLVALVKPGKSGKTDLTVKLSVGEVGTVDNASPGIFKKNNNNPNYLAWKTKTLTFERSKMSDVELILEDVYGIDIEFENENLRNCKLTAKFKERRAKDAIEIIARTFNLTFDMKNEKVILKGKGC